MSTFLTLLTGGGLAALGGLVSGALTNWQAAKRDRRRYEQERLLAQDAQRHELVIAREARRQERLERAYLELLTYLSRYLDWAKSVRPVWGSVPAPDPLPPQERWHMEALVTAYGSPEVLRLLREWGERAAKIEDVDATLRLLEQSRNPSEEFDREAMQKHSALPEYKQAMFEADKALRDRVQQELAGETEGRALERRGDQEPPSLSRA